MATQSPTRPAVRGKRVESVIPTSIDDTQPITQRHARLGDGFGALLSRSSTTESTKERSRARDSSFMVAALSVWVLWSGQDDGALVHWWAVALNAAFGLGAFIVPVLLVMLAYRLLFVSGQPVLLLRHYLGGLLFAIASAGLYRTRID